MLDVTLDLISQTASSSLFAFCFCNLIIVIILLGSKPVNSAHDQKQSDHAPPLSVVSIPKTVTHDDEAVKHNGLGMEERDVLEVVCQHVSNLQKELGAEEKFHDHLDDGNHDDHDQDHHDDELRKRVEDFIQKVNREWKEELIRTSQ
ncbi:uncharacterized protein LOC115716834 [Cannabis sativa]|uniref:uncharacterized protein LOC115716834 n=1 Tax=Cannabis sativa TaxID=3483 RepID=UPI0029C9D1A1|nr:uncharacterized protein LOC115716834 [Cannabis sativa]